MCFFQRLVQNYFVGIFKSWFPESLSEKIFGEFTRSNLHRRFAVKFAWRVKVFYYDEYMINNFASSEKLCFAKTLLLVSRKLKEILNK